MCIYTHNSLQREVKCACLLEFCSATDLRMEFLLEPVQVSHLVAKCELELAHKLLTVLRMRPRRANTTFLLVVFTVISLLQGL